MECYRMMDRDLPCNSQWPWKLLKKFGTKTIINTQTYIAHVFYQQWSFTFKLSHPRNTLSKQNHSKHFFICYKLDEHPFRLVNLHVHKNTAIHTCSTFSYQWLFILNLATVKCLDNLIHMNGINVWPFLEVVHLSGKVSGLG